MWTKRRHRRKDGNKGLSRRSVKRFGMGNAEAVPELSEEEIKSAEFCDSRGLRGKDADAAGF